MLPFCRVKCVYTVSRPTVGDCMQSVRGCVRNFVFSRSGGEGAGGEVRRCRLFIRMERDLSAFSSGTEAVCGRPLDNTVVRVSSMLS